MNNLEEEQNRAIRTEVLKEIVVDDFRLVVVLRYFPRDVADQRNVVRAFPVLVRQRRQGWWWWVRLYTRCVRLRVGT